MLFTNEIEQQTAEAIANVKEIRRQAKCQRQGTTLKETAQLDDIERSIAYAAESVTAFTNADDSIERHKEVETLLGHAYGLLENAVEDIRRIIKLKGA